MRIAVAVAATGLGFLSAWTMAGAEEIGGIPVAVQVARTTLIPDCAVFVDASASDTPDGTQDAPFATIGEAVAQADAGAVICVAEGEYREQIEPGDKPFTLAGGFRAGHDFSVRDSAAYPSRVVGDGSGSFVRIMDSAPTGQARTVIDGFDISGFSQAIIREFHETQRFDLTNNHIHDNRCESSELVGAAFALTNVTGRIEGNVIADNSCGRGGGGFLFLDSVDGEVAIVSNLIERNSGTEPDSAHGGGLYLFATRLRVTGNLFVGNDVTQWGGGLYIGADTGSGQKTAADLNWNVYRGNRAGNSGGGLFCDDGARCVSYHEIYDGNCGGNILLDSGPEGTGPTSARFDHLTNVHALDAQCQHAGIGVQISRGISTPESYRFINALFWGNAEGGDIAAFCDVGCDALDIRISHSMVQREHQSSGYPQVRFGEEILTPADPLFADSDAGDYHLQSTAGRWTPDGFVRDDVTSPAINAGTAVEGGETRNELGAYGGSPQSSRRPGS